MARVNATPRKLSRGTGATARGRHGLGYLDRGLAVLGKQKSEVGSSFPIEHLPCRGRDAGTEQCGLLGPGHGYPYPPTPRDPSRQAGDSYPHALSTAVHPYPTRPLTLSLPLLRL